MTYTDPETVERASRRERIRWNVWMIGSMLVAAAILIGPMVVAEQLGIPRELPAVIIALLLLDDRIWRWGVEHFDLVPPWQFREAAQEGDPDG